MRALLLCGIWAAALLIAAATARQARAFEPTGAYRQRTIKGFTVLISPAAAGHKEELENALKQLEAQLGRITDAVPDGPLERLRKVRIWVEWDNPRGKTAEFHPSADWLKKNGYNPDKAGGVEIGNLIRFVEWSRNDQPWMILHELAHAYHFTVLGEDHKGVKDAYRHAMADKLYDAVEYVHGGKRRKAYATENEKEYFAELSEAYFGKNDFYPFTREDLAKHDPTGYRLMEKVWGTKESNQAGD
jgi:hypothetical protein